MRVAVLPTGRMELAGAHRALARLFPAHEFYPIAKRPRDNEPFDSFTSDGRPLLRAKPNGNVDKIVQQMAAELFPGRHGQPPDLIVVLEDLELPNKAQPAVVTQVFAEATTRHLAMLAQADLRRAAKVAEAFLAKASFHLAVPMIEAWLFGDPAGPANAGAPAARLPPNWESARNPEDFLTRDAAYLADDGAACTAARATNTTPAWLKNRREEHPKAFMAWLCRDPTAKNCTAYRETHEGARALAALDWAGALRSPDHCAFLRALVLDLADGLGEPVPPFAEGGVSPVTSHRQRRAAPVLRNL